MTENDYHEKTKIFLDRQLNEFEITIKKLKKQRKIIKALFVSLIIVSISSSTVCAALAGFTIPPFVIPVLSTTAGLTTALSTKFNLKRKKEELNKTIEQLEKIKYKIDYVVSCNGNFTEDEYKEIIGELYFKTE